MTGVQTCALPIYRSDRSAVRAVVLSVEEVDGIGKLLTMHMGPDEVLVNIEVDMRDDLTGEEVEAVMRRIETAIRGVLPEAGDIFVEPIHV